LNLNTACWWSNLSASDLLKSEIDQGVSMLQDKELRITAAYDTPGEFLILIIMKNTFRFAKKLILSKQLFKFKFEIYRLDELESQAESENNFQLSAFEIVDNGDQVGRQGKYEGWVEIKTKAQGMRSFIKKDTRMNIWRDKFGTYTVSTALKHPKRNYNRWY
jgi:hypothetical protein